MKKILSLLVIVQFICLSQSAQTKRASDACPGSNEKSSTSSDYAYLSKRTSGDSDFSKPKYQSIYAKNTNANTPVKRGRAIVKEEKTASQTSVRTEKPTAPIIKEEKSNSSKAIREPEVEDEFVKLAPSEKTAETVKPTDVIPTKKAVVEESKPETTLEEGKTDSSKKSEKAITKNASTKTSDFKTTKTTKQKQQKKGTAKKLRLGKKCATDCPTF